MFEVFVSWKIMIKIKYKKLPDIRMYIAYVIARNVRMYIVRVITITRRKQCFNIKNNAMRNTHLTK